MFIALSRSVELLILLEIVVSLIELVLLKWHFVNKSSSVLHIDHVCLLTLACFILVYISFEKVPFDVVEAESELIDGVTVEFEGYVFSMVYAAEAVSAFLFLKLFSATSGFILAWLVMLSIVLYIGRIALARLLMTDLIEAILSIGLTYTIIFIMVVQKYDLVKFLYIQKLLSALLVKIKTDSLKSNNQCKSLLLRTCH